MKFTDAQMRRLNELGCEFDCASTFESAQERDVVFRQMEHACVESNRNALHRYREEGRPPFVNALSYKIASFLRGEGFLEVSTPTIIPKNFLERMTLGVDHPLLSQVFWLDEKSCLRPMLAPNLYDISQRLLNIFDRPFGVFEIGPCFRRDSQGGRHLENFTMVNFVEWGVPEREKTDRMKDLIFQLMSLTGLKDYELVEEESTVYGKTMDVVVGDTEIASGAFGPHSLDAAWHIDETWLGLGAGLERIVMMKEGYGSIQKAGRSLRYVGGINLNFK